MKPILFFLTLLTIGANPCRTQHSRFYTVQQSRYGIFHHYKNGGARLLSGIDYAAEMVEAQQEFYNMVRFNMQ